MGPVLYSDRNPSFLPSWRSKWRFCFSTTLSRDTFSRPSGGLSRCERDTHRWSRYTSKHSYIWPSRHLDISTLPLQSTLVGNDFVQGPCVSMTEEGDVEDDLVTPTVNGDGNFVSHKPGGLNTPPHRSVSFYCLFRPWPKSLRCCQFLLPEEAPGKGL